MMGNLQTDSGDQAVQRFLHLCLRGRWDPTALQGSRALAKGSDFDWDALRQVVQDENLAPLLYCIVRDQDIVPLSLEQDLGNVYYQNAVRNTLLFHELEGVVRELDTKGVPVLLLKGAALIETVYGNAAVRPMTDLDLLVRRKDVPTALHAFAALGYTPADVESFMGAAIVYTNKVVLCKPGPVETLLEVHWSLFDLAYYKHRLDMDWFWEATLPVRVGIASALALRPEAQLLHLCGHLLLHHSGRDGQWLIWLHDIAEVIAVCRAQIDWEEVLARAQACDLVLPLQQILPRVTNAWGAPVPNCVLERVHTLRASPAEVRYFNLRTVEHPQVAARFWYDLCNLPGWLERLRYASKSLMPSPAYLQRRYSIRHPFVVLLAYPYRWFRGLRSILFHLS